MFETAFALGVVFACVAMLVRLWIGPARRDRLDATLQSAWRGMVKRVHALRHRGAARAAAKRAADEALERARAGVHRDGNVIRPESFRSPRKPH